MTRRRSSALIALTAVLLVFVSWSARPLVTETEAAWTDSEYVGGSVATGSWPTSGYGRSAGGLITATGGISLPLLSQSWIEGTSTRNTIGKSSTTTDLSVVPILTVNAFSRTGSVSTCAAFSPGQPDSERCRPTTTSDSDATATMNSMTVSIHLLGLLGLGVVNSTMVKIDSAITAAALCGPGQPTTVAASSPSGRITVGTSEVVIPQPGEGASATTNGADSSEAILGLIHMRYSNVRLVSTRTVTATSVQSTLTVTFTVQPYRPLGAAVLGETRVALNLVTAQCGLGTSVYPSTPLSLPVAFGVERGADTRAPETTTAAATTEPTPAEPGSVETTTAEPAVTGTTVTTPASSRPTTTSGTPPSTTATTTTSREAVPPGDITGFTTVDGLECVVEGGTGYTGEVPVSCADAVAGTVAGPELVAASRDPMQSVTLTLDGVTETVRIRSVVRG
ncbi:hypothetical protein ABH922_003540 [Rhodococcus sp. 27YEA15]|uniref:hypothetical protein n=1 Tax=Rhodococcus sp. 27YEA15 TaxID=3156259 RepID=UPI003C7A4CA0